MAIQWTLSTAQFYRESLSQCRNNPFGGGGGGIDNLPENTVSIVITSGDQRSNCIKLLNSVYVL